MRIRAKGISGYGEQLTFSFNGQKFEGVLGDTVASALVNAGKYGFRKTESAEKRGLFCGMGVCNECTVNIDGEEGLLACMVPLAKDMDISEQSQYMASPRSDDETELSQLPEIELTPEVLVIGAGPAGLSIAARLGKAGIDLLVIDERKSPGGQYFKQPASDFKVAEEKLDPQYRKGRKLIKEFQASGAKSLFGVKIWGVFGVEHFLAYSKTNRYVIRPKNVIIATGAYERGLAFPGWTLPGVMTTGAGQTLLRSYQVAPGTAVAIAGNGPLNLQLAAELLKAGVKVEVLAESAKLVSLKNVALGGLLFLRSPRLALTGAGYIYQVLSAHTKILQSHAVIRAAGIDQVESVTLTKIDKDGYPKKFEGETLEKSFKVDSLTIGYGFIPSNEIARILGCEHIIDKRGKYLATQRSLVGATNVPGVWILGDGSGINGAQVAQASGVLLSYEFLKIRGLQSGISHTFKSAIAQFKLRNQLAFQEILWKIFDAPLLLDQLATDETNICRCLSIDLKEVKDGISADTLSAGASKRMNRVGMGRCQGRYCSPIAQKLVADKTGQEINQFSGFAPQVPIKPVEIGIIARSQDSFDE